MKLLVRQRVCQLVYQRRLPHAGWRPVGNIEFLLVIVVKRGSLFGKQIDRRFGQIKILWHEPEFLQS